VLLAGAVLLTVLLAGESSRAMLASARLSCTYISRLCEDVSVRLSVTEVHWVAVHAGNTAAAPPSEVGPVTPELTELICERQIRHGQKTGAFSQISLDILDRFLQSFQHMKSPYVLVTDL